MNNLYRDRIVTITGGTGSFGGQFVSHLLGTNARQIRIISRDEAKQDAMRHELHDVRLAFYLGDVRDRTSLRDAFRGAHYVLHAAALKQVPSCEEFPEQAFYTNVVGSKNVIDEALAASVERVICISTDKSVYPINAMGMTKALMEKLVQATAARHTGKTKVACVRYGNVVSSRGSVVPVFAEKIRRQRPLTITVPHMTRFLLTLADAVHLIEFALVEGQAGDIFVRKSPAATVEVIADAMRTIYASEVPIQIVGIRPGEKIHETLCTFAELARAEEHPQFYRIPMNGSPSHVPRTEPSSPPALEDYTSDKAQLLDSEAVARLLLSIEHVARDVLESQRLRQAR